MADDKRYLLDEYKTQNGVANTETHVYKRRWWVMAVFSLASLTQAMIWNTFGPIAESSELVFDWSDANIAAFSNISNLTYVILVIPMGMLTDTKGLRFTILLSAFFMVICTSIRCFTLEPVPFTITAYTCALLQGITGTVTFAGPALLASVWFPPEQRPVATAIASFFNLFGVSVSFILGPFLVPNPIYSVENGNASTINDSLNMFEPFENMHSNHSSLRKVANIEEIRSGISNLMYIHCGLAVALFILVVIYFPARPKLPPSITASIKRVNYKHALVQLVRNGQLWLIALAGALPIGVLGCWTVLLDVIVKELNVSQIDAGWVGFWNMLASSAVGILIAKISGYFPRRRKVLLIVLYTCGAACLVWFAVISKSQASFDLTSMYVSCILAGIFVFGPAPLFYELCSETSYPVAEGVTGAFYTSLNDIFGMTFLTIASVPNVGTLWMTWSAVGAVMVGIAFLFVFPEKYNRTDIDITID